MEELFDDEGVDEEFEIEGKGKHAKPTRPCHAMPCHCSVLVSVFCLGS